MDPYHRSKRHSSSRRYSDVALALLVLLGCGVLIFAMVLIACSFVINYDDDFETTDGKDIEVKAKSEFTYTQYWAGIPFLITGVLAIFSGIFQRDIGLTISMVIFSVACVVITLFIVSLDGTTWSQWRTLHNKISYWDTQKGIDCKTSSSDKCECRKGTEPALFDDDVECEVIKKISSLYGAVVSSAIFVAAFCLFIIIIVTKSLSWKQVKFAHHRSYFNDTYHVEPRRQPSVVDLPLAKPGPGHLERSYPY